MVKTLKSWTNPCIQFNAMYTYQRGLLASFECNHCNTTHSITTQEDQLVSECLTTLPWMWLRCEAWQVWMKLALSKRSEDEDAIVALCLMANHQHEDMVRVADLLVDKIYKNCRWKNYPLRGSDKQVRWAHDIRSQIVNKLNLLSGHRPSLHTWCRLAIKMLGEADQASWIIEKWKDHARLQGTKLLVYALSLFIVIPLYTDDLASLPTSLRPSVGGAGSDW